MLDNAFLEISGFERAQALPDGLNAARLHVLLDEFAARFCPVTEQPGIRYHWPIMQAGYSTGILFKDRDSLGAIYGNLIRTAIHTVRPGKAATFLGRKLDPRYLDELGGTFSTRIEGTCVKHHMGPAPIKIYDKYGIVLRVELTVGNVSFFKHHQTVEQRNGQEIFKLAPLKKGIYSLPLLDGLCRDANRRYLEFLAEIDGPSAGRNGLDRISSPRKYEGRSYRGINFFTARDQELLHAISRGQYLISGFRGKDIRKHFLKNSPGWVSRSLKRFRVHGLIRRVGKTCKYYLIRFGKRFIATGQQLKDFFLVPGLAFGTT